MKKYYQLTQNNNEASIVIYGDIVSWKWVENDVTSYTLSKEIEGIEVDVINVYINSYGGEVSEGVAIHTALKRHKAKVKTYCDGFACSIASVVFMAGDERIMYNTSLLMIHNAWTYASGNSSQLRKTADDLEVITQSSINAYMANVLITEEELKTMLDAETWIDSNKALEMGFATTIMGETTSKNPNQSIKAQIVNNILERQKELQALQQKEKEESENPKPESEATPEGEENGQQKEHTKMYSSFFRAIIK